MMRMKSKCGSGAVVDDDDDERKEAKCSTKFKTCTPPLSLNKWMRNRQKHATTKHSKLTYFKVFFR